MPKGHLLRSQTYINDEFYTSYKDIEKEFIHYIPKFKNKIIYCNCDTKDSNFVKYFKDHFDEYGLKKFIYSSCDFASLESVELLKIADIVITNPPFSLYDKFIKLMLSYPNLDLILLAPFLNRVNPNIGLPLWLGQHRELLPYQWGKTSEESYKRGMYLGFERKRRMAFENPTYLVTSKLVAVDWITTFSFVQDQMDRKLRLVNGIDYRMYKDQYDFYEDILMKDGTRPLRLNNFRALPDNYYGWFLTAIGILDILSNEEFEWYGTSYKAFFNTTSGQLITPIAHKHSDTMMKVRGKQGFHGILARRRDSMLPPGVTRESLTPEYIKWYNDYINRTVQVSFALEK